MADIDGYLRAATRDHTRRSYQSAIRHFEQKWDDFLPASTDNVARYLAEYAQTLSISMLYQQSATITQWHVLQDFPDPTRAPHVRKVLKGIQALHPTQERCAKPLQLAQLEQLVASLDAQITTASSGGNAHQFQVHTRNKTLVLIDFWWGSRSDELNRLQIERITVEPGRGITIFLPRTRTDHSHVGTTRKAPTLSHLYPVAAYEAWLATPGLTGGPVSRRIGRWSRTVTNGLQVGSIMPLLHALLHRAGLPQSDHYSSHSLRRDFAAWAGSNQWDLKVLMEYVGWKDIRSAMHYIDATDPFA